MTDVGVEIPTLINARCDRCGAPALVVGVFLNGDLYFCGHHAKKIAPQLARQALRIHDPEAVLLPII